MNKSYKNLIMVLMIFATVAGIAVSQTYTYPALSPKDIATWVIRGGQIASGSAAPTTVASEGALYVDTSTPTAPLLYRSDGSNWRAISGSGGGGGVSTHSDLLGLDYADAGHTGFNSAASFSAHTEDYINPHGATMTVEEALTIGNSTTSATAFIDSPLSGLIRIATDCSIVGSLTIGSIAEYENNAAAAAGGLASGTLYRNASGVVLIVF